MKSKFKRTLALALCVLLCVAMVASPAVGRPRTTTEAGTLTGKVLVSGTNTVMEGVIMKVVGSTNTYEAVTDAEGSYSLSLPAGTYNVTASKDGYASQTLTAAVKSGTKTVLNFALLAVVGEVYGEVQGVVTDAATGQALPNASVSLNVEGLVPETTAANGQYAFVEVAEGTYTVSSSVYGYQTATKSISVTPGQVVSCDFQLVPNVVDFGISGISASPNAVSELAVQPVQLIAQVTGATGYTWEQVKGPKVSLLPQAATATIDASQLNVAVETELVFKLTVTNAQGETRHEEVSVWVLPTDMGAALGDYVQVGGSANAVTKFSVGEQEWALFNIGSKLQATPITTAKGVVHQVILPGFIKDIAVVNYSGVTYAIVAVGEAGVAVVNVTDPANMQVVSVSKVNYYKDNLTFTETGGGILTGNVIEGHGAITAIATDATNIYLGDADFGIHKTALTNLLGVNGPVLESDGTLLIDQEIYTLQYAGENPWGGPNSLCLYGDKLVAGLSYLGMVVYDAATLERVGYYNLYTDEARTEDFFGAMKITEAVAADSVSGEKFLDPVTGMPDYRQVNYEMMEVMRGTAVDAPTPWADFDRQGKWFYNVLDIDIAQQGQRTIAYIAYALGGIVAVDMTGIESASTTNFLNGKYLGYFPAVPANGPDTTGEQSQSLLPYFGAGMLKEAGIISIEVNGDNVFATDHFAGLVVLNGATNPDLNWHGANPPYNNDTDGIANSNIPEFEDITTYDMSPWDSTDNESLPTAFFQAPCLLATTELNGHGNKFLLLDNYDIVNPGTVDVLECSGAGGFVFVDVKDLSASTMEERFEILAYYPSTDAVGAAVDGSATQTIAIGHSSGLDASENYLYISDGPHGITAWNITDAQGYATDAIGLVANTVQDEYPQTYNGETIYPPSHTVNNVISPDKKNTWALCVGNGLRKVNIEGVEGGLGQVGSPMLIKLHQTDSFEHNADWGTVKQFNFQDHAYDVEFIGNYAFVADGSNGLTIYDVSKDPTRANSGFFVNNIGKAKTQPLLGNCTGVELWEDPASGKIYAITACGPYGVGVVDVTDVHNLQLVKVFEPIKYEEGEVGSADGQAIDVTIIRDKAYFSYDSFGIVCYQIGDLIKPLEAGVEPTDLFNKTNSGVVLYDYRPEAAGRFKLQEVPGNESVAGGANRLVYTEYNGNLYIYAAFGEAGVLKIDYTNPAAPMLLERRDTIGECSDVAIANGRVYAADGSGGFLIFN